MAVAFLATVIFTSCKKNAENFPDQPTSNSNVAQLAQKYLEPVGAGSAALKQEYGNLNEADLKTFFLSMYKAGTAKSKAGISETEYLQLFDKVNAECKLQFNKPLNKLNEAEIAKTIDRKKTVQSFNQPTDPPTGCGFYNYFIYCGKNPYLTPSAPYVSIRTVDYHLDDCNGYECKYYGRFNRLVPITQWGYDNINYVDASYDGTYTYTLHKKNMTDLFFTPTGGINAHLRMGLVYDIPEE